MILLNCLYQQTCNDLVLFSKSAQIHIWFFLLLLSNRTYSLNKIANSVYFGQVVCFDL